MTFESFKCNTHFNLCSLSADQTLSHLNNNIKSKNDLRNHLKFKNVITKLLKRKKAVSFNENEINIKIIFKNLKLMRTV